LISTNFETVALMLTVPVVDCPKQVAAAAISISVNRVDLKRGLIFLRGICVSLRWSGEYGGAAVTTPATAAATQIEEGHEKVYGAVTVN
jgi:hypothetical protein